MHLFANKQKLILTVVSAVLFWTLSNIGYKVGVDFGLTQMYHNFGEPRDLYPVLFSLVMVFTGYFIGFLGIIITCILMHQIGRRTKVAVGKPTFYGFLLYLLTLLIIILNFNRTH